MSENNSFLSEYNKKEEGSMKPKGSNKPKDSKKNKGEENKPSMKYEEKSGFVKPEKSETPPPSGKSIRPKTIIWIAAGLVLAAAVIVTLVLVLGGGAEVINFEDWEQGDVQLWANEKGIKLQIEQQFSDVFEEGRVMNQSIPEGGKIKKGDFLKITVSKGHDLSVTLELPDLLGMTKTQVEQWAEENYMTKVRITTEYSNDVEAGTVIRYEINDDTVVDEVRRDTPLYVIVSKGREEAVTEVTVPDFKTMALSECFVFANDNGIDLIIEERYDDYVPKGSIISQSAKADEKVKTGESITLVVSKGKKITVPDFSSYSKERAQSVAAELGIPVSINERYSSRSEGKFISQSIDAGTVYEEGDFLELCYSMGNKIVLGSFVGQTRDAIEAWANELNEFNARITIKVTYTQNNEPAGTIIYQDIANKTIGRGTTIRITVSKGNLVYVPDFVAQAGLGYGDVVTRQIALQMCEQAGLVPIFVEAASSGRLPSEVWSQSIAAGTEVYEGTNITLKYTPSQQAQVPNFDGMTQQEVLDAGYDKQFTITFVQSEDEISGYDEQIYEQSVLEGTTLAMGEVITLNISAEAAPAVTPTTTPAVTPTTTP